MRARSRQFRPMRVLHFAKNVLEYPQIDLSPRENKTAPTVRVKQYPEMQKMTIYQQKNDRR